MAGAKSGCKGGDAFLPLVAFDFDGTLTFRDSFIAFLAWRRGLVRFCLGFWRLIPATARYFADRDRETLKCAMIREFLRGADLAAVEADARRFAALKSIDMLRPDALRAWRMWQARGARLVIVTASPEIVVAPFARGLGAETVLGSRLAVDAANRITGALDGANCRGAEKAARLRQAFGDDVRLEAAYGDSEGDREMLALAAEPSYRVFGTRK
jgi:phosphatidylglycerophosphatase C